MFYKHHSSFKLWCFCRSSSLPDAIAGAIHNVPTMDTQWIETTAKKAALKLEKLDTDLKNYKSNSIKESIRYGSKCFTMV